MENFILEFIVVVLGILFALFLNRVNEKIQHKKRIHSIMNIIVANMNKDLSTIKYIIKGIDHKFALLNKLEEKSLMSEEELKECMLLGTDYTLFGISKRGYNLLKDARIDFEFKESELISTIILNYDEYLSLFEIYDRLAEKISEQNMRLLSNLNLHRDIYNNILSEEVKSHIQTNDYLNMVQYFLYIMAGEYKAQLEAYKNSVVTLLQKIDKSDFK